MVNPGPYLKNVVFCACIFLSLIAAYGKEEKGRDKAYKGGAKQLSEKPTINCDQETRTAVISVSVPKSKEKLVTTFKLEKLLGGYGELLSDSLSPDWIAGNLGANGVTYKGVKNGIYRILIRQLPANLPPDQADKDFGITYSDTVTVRCQKFRKERSRSKRCGVMGPIDLSSRSSLYKLVPGDTIWTSDFDVIILRAQKTGNGTFSGKGYVNMPEPFKMQVAVTFENAVFNDDFELIKGKMDAVYDLNWKGVGNAMSFIKGARVLVNTIGDAVTYALDAQIISSDHRIQSIADELVRNSRERLPDDLQERFIVEAEKFKAVKREYDNASTVAERKAATDHFKVIQSRLAALKTETTKFVKDSESIIISSLLSIQNENNTAELNRLKDKVDIAAKALDLPTTPEPQLGESLNQELGESMPGSLMVIEEDEVESVKTTAEQSYYGAQKEYLKAQIASLFTSKMKNANGARQIGETLKLQGMKLSSYIYEAGKQKVDNESIIGEVKAVIYSSLEKVLREQVYEK